MRGALNDNLSYSAWGKWSMILIVSGMMTSWSAYEQGMPPQVSIESYYEDVSCLILVANAPYQVPDTWLIVAELAN